MHQTFDFEKLNFKIIITLVCFSRRRKDDKDTIAKLKVGGYLKTK